MSRRQRSVLVLSHLRWNFVFQRPQHLIKRCAREHRVVFFEEAIFDDAVQPRLETRIEAPGILIAVPHLPKGMSASAADSARRAMIDSVLGGESPIIWYYTPMALPYVQHVRARAIVYDCMDELSLFQGAPPELAQREAQLFACADIVFTGGQSLYEHKRRTTSHPNLHAFPSSVDIPHFARAREALDEPADQAAIAHPRAGFFGVIDERLDIPLLAELAELRPDVQFVMLGPIAKISPDCLPRRSNIHWLGPKRYEELPAYLAGWDVALLLFARNDATRFISPTKTPEYLAAGRPVVSTSVRDVVVPYGRDGLAWIADEPGEFAAAIDEALASDPIARRAHADGFLADLSWDRTWSAMWNLVEHTLNAKKLAPLRSGTANIDARMQRAATEE